MATDALAALTGAATLTTSAAPSLGTINRYDATSGNLTPTIPALSGVGNVGASFSAQKTDSTANIVTLTCTGGDTFVDGATTEVISAQGGERLVQEVTISGTKYWMVTRRSNNGVAFDAHAATSKTTPVNADELPLVDSAASNALKKLTWQNLKTAAVSAATVGPYWYPAGYKSANYYYCNSSANSGTSATQANNNVRVSAWIVTASITITRLFAEYTVAGNAGAVFRIGIWNDDGTGQPGTLVLDAGTIAVDGTPAVSELTVSQALSPGLYWVGGAVQSAATTLPTMRTVNVLGIPGYPTQGTTLPAAGGAFVGWTQSSVSGALGAFTPVLGTNAPRIGFKVT
jgi:hypothetical protein